MCQKFSKDEALITVLWQEIEITHSQSTRYYHRLKHLEHIYKELETFEITPLLEFAIFYHDIVYDAKRNDNERQSALVARERLEQLTVPQKLNEQVFQLIVETKIHNASSEENKLFLDADLSILGSKEKNYNKYIQNVRKEYAIYNDTTYFTGRRKVLEMFLEKERIYESEHFYDLYENKARKNLEQELKKFYSL
ncbi:MAG TPA: hypothetical protein EYG94_02220 [Campylobacterales bacterium]|nr:hypothetical protein [Campylobacterales bacterium]